MLTKFQAYVIVTCAVAAVGLLIVCQLWPQSLAVGAPGGPSPQASDESKSTGNASERHRVTQATQLPDGCFRLTAKTHNTANLPTGGEEKLDGDMELIYAHQKVPDGIVLSFYSLGMKTFDKGELTESVVLSRDKEVTQTGSRRSERTFDELPLDQQHKAEASFATPFCKIVFDDDHNETRREILPNLGTSAINEGVLNTTRLVHGPFARRSRNWTSVGRIPIQNGLAIDCPVTYTKADGPKNGVTLAGSFAKDEIHSESSDVLIKNVSANLSGTEFFDEELGDYTSGELNLKYSFQVFEGGTQTVTLHGEIALVLERVAAKKP